MKRIRMAMEATVQTFGLDLKDIVVVSIEVVHTLGVHYEVRVLWRDNILKENTRGRAYVEFTSTFDKCNVSYHESWTV